MSLPVAVRALILQGSGSREFEFRWESEKGAYVFKSRFEGGPGTNPEELIGAAHAGCFSMAFSVMLGEAGFTANSIETHADITFEKQADGFAITASHLTVVASIPGIDAAKFAELGSRAKAGGPVWKLLNAKITMEANYQV